MPSTSRRRTGGGTADPAVFRGGCGGDCGLGGGRGDGGEEEGAEVAMEEAQGRNARSRAQALKRMMTGR